MNQSQHPPRHHLSPLTVLLALLLPVSAVAVVDNGLVDGANGVIHVTGALSESPCRLDMDSAWQEVSLGTSETADLKQPGDRGTPVALSLHLRDCLRSGSDARDRHSGNLMWDPTRPAVTVTFEAPADLANPYLFRAQGTSGLGLRLLDGEHRSITPGERSRLQWLNPGDDRLVYYIQPERTGAELMPGAYSAVIHFRMSYD